MRAIVTLLSASKRPLHSTYSHHEVPEQQRCIDVVHQRCGMLGDGPELRCLGLACLRCRTATPALVKAIIPHCYSAATVCRAWDPAQLLEPPPVVMHAMKLGKSFSSAMATRGREHQPRQAHHGGDSAASPTPANTHYTSITQFHQRVELYHGRWGAGAPLP